jgi:hypothetical protein
MRAETQVPWRSRRWFFGVGPVNELFEGHRKWLVFHRKTSEVPDAFPIASNQFGIVCVRSWEV